MADVSLTNNSSYAYITFNGADSSSSYNYKLVLVAPAYSLAGTPNTVRDSSMSGWEFVASINGGFFWYNNSKSRYEANGIEKQHWTWNENDDTEYSSVLAVGSNGADNTSLTFNSQSSMASWWGDWAITGGISLAGGSYISTDVDTSTGHSFIGQKGSEIIMGVSKSGVSGATLRSHISGLGYTGVELDGGGSTSFMYNGTQYSNTYNGRQVKNVICLYRQKKSTPSTYTISVSAYPSNAGSVSGGGSYSSGSSVTLTATANTGYTFTQWSDGNTSNPRTITVTSSASYTAYFSQPGITDIRKLGAVAGVSYIYKDNSLHSALPWYRLNSGNLQGRPLGIYMMKTNNLIPLILKYFVNFEPNGGSAIDQQNYYTLIESISSFPTPTHDNYESLAVAFDGWFYDNNFETKVTALGTEATGDRTYYAKWSQSKTQYSGNYIVSGTATQSIGEDFYSGSSSPVYFSSGMTHSSSVSVTSIHVDFDNCTSSNTDYIKPQVDYGYFTGGEGAAYYTNIGSLYSQGETPSEKSVSFTLPSGSSVGFRVYQSGSRTKLYLNSGGNYKYGGNETEYADWQDSSSPPSGSWANGYPITRTVSRYYNGSSWTSWT